MPRERDVMAAGPACPAGLVARERVRDDFRALVSCQSIGAANTATIANVSTGDFKADTGGNSVINARVSLPRPCIAPIIFVTGPTGSDFWFSVTGSG